MNLHLIVLNENTLPLILKFIFIDKKLTSRQFLQSYRIILEEIVLLIFQ